MLLSDPKYILQERRLQNWGREVGDWWTMRKHKREVGTDTFHLLSSARPLPQCLLLKTEGILVMAYNVAIHATVSKN